MSYKQRVMLFWLFQRAAAAMRREADDELRHELTEQALGVRKSWTKLNNGEVDKIKLLLQSISGLVNGDPLPLDNAGDRERARLVRGVERYLPVDALHKDRLGVFWPEYVETVSAAKFGGDGKGWRALPLPQLRQLHLTIKARARAKKVARNG
ncbi:MAG: hypothetical protein LBD30_07940 [Verrucomicrobiales bacterium]|nr:hypothetical protein [Verrucomicrobiales bacterium]